MGRTGKTPGHVTVKWACWLLTLEVRPSLGHQLTSGRGGSEHGMRGMQGCNYLAVASCAIRLVRYRFPEGMGIVPGTR
jgi:hypothetical protein